MEHNKEQITKALECCKDAYDCLTCDIYKRGCTGGFRIALAKKALAIIKELTEENERLKKHNAALIEDNHILSSECIPMAKADTVREMHHKIWLEFSDCFEEETVSIGSLRASVDQIAKEMVEEPKC